MPEEINWQIRELIRKSAEEAQKEAVHEIRTLLGISNDDSLDAFRENLKYARRLRLAADARAAEINTGWVKGPMGVVWGFLSAAALGLATWLFNGGWGSR